MFLTDASYPNSLAAIRALGREGFIVTAGEREGTPWPATLGFWSRHCAERFAYPDPDGGVDATARALAEKFDAQPFAAAIPVGLDMCEVFVRHRDALNVPTMLPEAASFALAADKRATYEYAASIGIPVPRTVPATRWREIGLPVVFKEARRGAFVASTSDAAEQYAASLGTGVDRYVAQEYVPGTNGFGYFGFFRHGKEIGYFMHERLVQFPREGGPSVVARSVRNWRLRVLGRTLLESLNWNGVAMVEFKRSARDDEFYLMEINPKLWGSLDLAISAGCNFPVWIARALTGRCPQPKNEYREGVTFQWVVPHGLASFIRYPELRPSLVRNVVRGEVRTDVCWSDPLPTAAGIIAMARRAARK
ncbi:MAG: hypothetical protein JO199_07030 [Candidatus Eremiobacteraeota bacterium]|nr:hypothetical protein [Candidatus Eremiobacteraeota bacterium]